MFKRLRSCLICHFSLVQKIKMSSLGLRKIGDAVVLILPKVLLEQLNAKAGDSLNYNFEDRQLIIEPKRKLRKLPKCDLSELLLELKQIKSLLV